MMRIKTIHYFIMILVNTLLLNTILILDAGAQQAPLGLGRVEQIALTVSDLERAQQFYEEKLGLRKIISQENLLIFDLAGQRLLLGTPEHPGDLNFPLPITTTIYLRCADLSICMKELETRGVKFILKPEFVARQPTYDLWLVFFRDPDGNTFALLSESPRGYNPVTHEKTGG